MLNLSGRQKQQSIDYMLKHSSNSRTYTACSTTTAGSNGESNGCGAARNAATTEHRIKCYDRQM